MCLGDAGEAYFISEDDAALVEPDGHERGGDDAAARLRRLPQLETDGSVTIDGVRVGDVSQWDAADAAEKMLLSRKLNRSLSSGAVSDMLQPVSVADVSLSATGAPAHASAASPPAGDFALQALQPRAADSSVAALATIDEPDTTALGQADARAAERSVLLGARRRPVMLPGVPSIVTRADRFSPLLRRQPKRPCGDAVSESELATSSRLFCREHDAVGGAHSSTSILRTPVYAGTGDLYTGRPPRHRLRSRPGTLAMAAAVATTAVDMDDMPADCEGPNAAVGKVGPRSPPMPSALSRKSDRFAAAATASTEMHVVAMTVGVDGDAAQSHLLRPTTALASTLFASGIETESASTGIVRRRRACSMNMASIEDANIHNNVSSPLRSDALQHDIGQRNRRRYPADAAAAAGIPPIPQSPLPPTGALPPLPASLHNDSASPLLLRTPPLGGQLVKPADVLDASPSGAPSATPKQRRRHGARTATEEELKMALAAVGQLPPARKREDNAANTSEAKSVQNRPDTGANSTAGNALREGVFRRVIGYFRSDGVNSIGRGGLEAARRGVGGALRGMTLPVDDSDESSATGSDSGVEDDKGEVEPLAAVHAAQAAANNDSSTTLYRQINGAQNPTSLGDGLNMGTRTVINGRGDALQVPRASHEVACVIAAGEPIMKNTALRQHRHPTPMLLFASASDANVAQNSDEAVTTNTQQHRDAIVEDPLRNSSPARRHAARRRRISAHIRANAVSTTDAEAAAAASLQGVLRPPIDSEGQRRRRRQGVAALAAKVATGGSYPMAAWGGGLVGGDISNSGLRRASSGGALIALPLRLDAPAASPRQIGAGVRDRTSVGPARVGTGDEAIHSASSDVHGAGAGVSSAIRSATSAGRPVQPHAIALPSTPRGNVVHVPDLAQPKLLYSFPHPSPPSARATSSASSESDDDSAHSSSATFSEASRPGTATDSEHSYAEGVEGVDGSSWVVVPQWHASKRWVNNCGESSADSRVGGRTSIRRGEAAFSVALSNPVAPGSGKTAAVIAALSSEVRAVAEGEQVPPLAAQLMRNTHDKATGPICTSQGSGGQITPAGVGSPQLQLVSTAPRRWGQMIGRVGRVFGYGSGSQSVEGAELPASMRSPVAPIDVTSDASTTAATPHKSAAVDPGSSCIQALAHLSSQQTAAPVLAPPTNAVRGLRGAVVVGDWYAGTPHARASPEEVRCTASPSTITSASSMATPSNLMRSEEGIVRLGALNSVVYTRRHLAPPPDASNAGETAITVHDVDTQTQLPRSDATVLYAADLDVLRAEQLPQTSASGALTAEHGVGRQPSGVNAGTLRTNGVIVDGAGYDTVPRTLAHSTSAAKYQTSSNIVSNAHAAARRRLGVLVRRDASFVAAIRAVEAIVASATSQSGTLGTALAAVLLPTRGATSGDAHRVDNYDRRSASQNQLRDALGHVPRRDSPAAFLRGGPGTICMHRGGAALLPRAFTTATVSRLGDRFEDLKSTVAVVADVKQWKRDRTMSFDLSSLTHAQRDIAYDTFALWVIEAAVASQSTTLTTKIVDVTEEQRAPASASKHTTTHHRLTGRRNRRPHKRSLEVSGHQQSQAVRAAADRLQHTVSASPTSVNASVEHHPNELQSMLTAYPSPSTAATTPTMQVRPAAGVPLRDIAASTSVLPAAAEASTQAAPSSALRVSRRERYLSWIPIVGPLLTPSRGMPATVTSTASASMTVPDSTVVQIGPEVGGSNPVRGRQELNSSVTPPGPAHARGGAVPSTPSAGSGRVPLLQGINIASVSVFPNSVEADTLQRAVSARGGGDADSVTSDSASSKAAAFKPPATSRGGASSVTSTRVTTGTPTTTAATHVLSEVEGGYGSTEDDGGSSVISAGAGGGGSTTSRRTAAGSRRTLRPTPAQLAALPLVQGANELIFTVDNGRGALVSVHANLYLWSPHARIVVSDVDGTITRSDVLGHLFFLVGRDWTHAGVAELYTNIAANGYHMLYLTSRAIGQSDATKMYLTNIKQPSSDATNAVGVEAVPAKVPLLPGQAMPAAGASGTVGTDVHAAPDPALAAATQAMEDALTSSMSAGANDAHSAATVTPRDKIGQLTPNGSTATSPRLAAAFGGEQRPAPPSATPLPSVGVAGGDAVSAAMPTSPVFQLPPGPVIASPDRLFTALRREVIQRRPHEFKIAALSEVARLFARPGSGGSASCPFVAGFGNRDTDVMAYGEVGVPKAKIFIINPAGEIRPASTAALVSSYPSINTIVNEMFPPISEESLDAAAAGARYGKPGVSSADAAFGDASYWRRVVRLDPAEEAEALREAAEDRRVAATLGKIQARGGVVPPSSVAGVASASTRPPTLTAGLQMLAAVPAPPAALGRRTAPRSDSTPTTVGVQNAAAP